MHWWWIGITNNRAPAGQRKRGAVIARTHLEGTAIQIAMIKGPAEDGLEYLAGKMPPEYGDPPDGYAERWISNEEAAQLALEWGGQRLATADEIKAAILDDEAKAGDPLFRGRR